MTFIRRRWESFAFEYMAEMTTTSGANDLCARSAKRLVLMSSDGPRDGVEEGRPATTARELGGALVERCPTPNARISPLILVVFVFSSTGGFCALLAENPKLFWG